MLLDSVGLNESRVSNNLRILLLFKLKSLTSSDNALSNSQGIYL